MLSKSAHFLLLQNPTLPLLCLSYPIALLSESSSKSKPLPSKPTSNMTSMSSPSSSVSALSILALPLWTMPTNCSTKFPNQTLWSSTTWPADTPAPMPLFGPLCSFLISYALALSLMTIPSLLFSRYVQALRHCKKVNNCIALLPNLVSTITYMYVPH